MTTEITTLANGLRVVTAAHAAPRDGVARRVGRRPARATRRKTRARHLAFPRAHGVQGHEAAQRPSRSPRRSRRSAASSTPPPAWRRRPISRASSRAMKAWRWASWPTSCRIRRSAPGELERERAGDPAGDRRHRDSPDEIAYELLQDAAFPAGGRAADPRHPDERRQLHRSRPEALPWSAAIGLRTW